MSYYCKNCGQELAEGARYCTNCGKPVDSNNASTQRKSSYAGEIHKCPSCGEVLNAFVTTCPSCGYELRSSNVTSRVNELAMKLEQVKSPEQKDDLIRNFYIPNTKEDICEFLILAVSNIKAGDDCEGAWRAKLEQTYQKAKLSFNNDPSFKEIEKMYFSASKEIPKKTFKKFFSNKYSILLAILIVGTLMITIGMLGISIGFTGLTVLSLLGYSLLFEFMPAIAVGMLIYDLVCKFKRK